MVTRAIRISCLALAAGALCCAGCEETPTTFTLTARALYEQAEQIRDVVGTSHGVTLTGGVLVEDDGGAFGLFDPSAGPGRALRKDAAGPTDSPYWEPISRSVWARKRLPIGPLSARSARLLFFAARAGDPPAPLRVRVNGTELRFDPAGGGGPDGRPRWWQMPIDPALLLPGENEIILRSDSEEPSWLLMIAPKAQFARGSTTRRTPPGRSGRSGDGGATWQARKLGRDESAEGEYVVRLALDQHVLAGTWTGPVMDLAARKDKGPISQEVTFARARGRIVASIPGAGRIRWEIRNGTLGMPGRTGWGGWTLVRPDTRGRFALAVRHRYVQLRAAVTTEDPAVAPVIRSIRVRGEEPQVAPIPPGLIRVIEFRNRRVVSGSTAFTHATMPNARLKALDGKFGLAAYLRRARTEFEQATVILKWLARSSRRGLFLPDQRWCATDILGTQLTRPARPLPCQIVLCQALLSRGITARLVLFAGPASCRSAVEFWSTDYDKWVLLDGRRGRYFIDAGTGIPMGALELHDRFIDRGVRWTAPAAADWDRAERAEAQPTAEQLGLRVVTLRGVQPVGEAVERWPAGLPLLIPRNNFASVSRPVPLNPEWTEPGWTGYVAWGGSRGPKAGPWLPTRVDRRRDFNWTLYRTQMEVRYGKAPGELWVYLHTRTPSFDTFQVNVDETGWKRVPASFRWLLVPGPNNLKVRVRTRAEAVGPISAIGVHYFPPAPPSKRRGT